MAGFHDWMRGVEDGPRYELVDGEPVMMAGANNRHDRIVRNALRHVADQLKPLGVRLALADLWSGVALRPGPRLVEPEGDLSLKFQI